MPRFAGETPASYDDHIRNPETDYSVDDQSSEGVDYDTHYVARPVQQTEYVSAAPVIEAELSDRAWVLHDSLSFVVERLAGGIIDTLRLRSLDSFIESAEEGCPDTLEEAGLKVTPEWLTDTLWKILGDLPVEVEVARSAAPFMSDSDSTSFSTRFTDYRNMFHGQEPGLALGAMLRRIEGLERIRPVVLVEDRFRASDHDATVNAAYAHLLKTGVMYAEGQPGKDFLIVPLSRGEANAKKVRETLERTEAGMVVPSSDGAVRFRPFPRLANGIARQWDVPTTGSHYHEGVLLQGPDGEPTDVVVEAASYLNPINSFFTHLRVCQGSLNGEKRFDTEKDQALSMLLRAMDKTYPDRDHRIYYDPKHMTPTEVSYVVVRMLQHEATRIIKLLSALSDVRSAMKPLSYFEHNYAQRRIWPEDLQAIKTVATELPLYYSPGEVSSAAIFGYGPLTITALAVAPLMEENVMIDISDPVPENVAFAEEWFNGTPGVGSFDKQQTVYKRFGDEFQRYAQDKEFFARCTEQLRSKGRLRVAALEDLPSNSVQLLVESFVSCSRSVEKYGFFEAIRQKARILKWDNKSMMISTHMVRSGGWNNSGDDEGVLMPAANLSIDDIRNAYESAGLEVVRCVPLRSDDAIRKDYKGMVVIFARRARHTRPSGLIPVLGSSPE